MATRNRHGMHSYGGKYNKPFDTTKGSIFACRPYQRDINNDKGVTIWIKVKDYCDQRFVTYKQVKYFARKKWIAVSSCKNRLYVCELCPDAIDVHLSGCST